MRNGIDVQSLFNMYSVPFKDLKQEVKEGSDGYNLTTTGVDDYVIVPENNIEDLSNAEFVEFDYDGYVECIKNLFEDQEDIVGYVMFNFNANWRGAQAYKVVKTIEEVLNIEYDHTLTYFDKGNDYAHFILSSHDVPTGGNLYVVAVRSEPKYEVLDYYYRMDDMSKFDFVKEYVKTKVRESK